MNRYDFPLSDDLQRQRAIRWLMKAPLGWIVTIAEDRRTKDQNALLWPLLTEISVQATHCGMKFSPEDWKDLLMAQLRKEMRLVPNLDNDGFVNLGNRTSRLTKREFSDLLELVYKLGAEKGVTFQDPIHTGRAA